MDSFLIEAAILLMASILAVVSTGERGFGPEYSTATPTLSGHGYYTDSESSDRRPNQ